MSLSTVLIRGSGDQQQLSLNEQIAIARSAAFDQLIELDRAAARSRVIQDREVANIRQVTLLKDFRGT